MLMLCKSLVTYVKVNKFKDTNLLYIVMDTDIDQISDGSSFFLYKVLLKMSGSFPLGYVFSLFLTIRMMNLPHDVK